MKALKIITIAILLIFTGCKGTKHIPRGVDEAGVWKVEHFTDAFGDQTEEPMLVGIIEGGEFEHKENLFYQNNYSGTGQLTLRFFLKRTGEMVKDGKKDVPEEIPILELYFSYKTSENSSYSYSYLWDDDTDWDIKIETEGLEPFTGRKYFESRSYRWLTFTREDAEKIISVLTNGSETTVRARSIELRIQEDYSLTIDTDTLKDFQEVLSGYRYHYSEYVRNSK